MADGWDLTRDEADEPVLAGRGRRLLAVVINSALVFLLPFAIFLAVDTPATTAGDGGTTETSDGSTVGVSIMFTWCLVFGIVTCVLVAKRGQSIGKAVVGIKVLRTDGSRAGFWRIVGLRWFVMVLGSAVFAFLGLIDTLFIFRGDRRCLHDLIADTIVVMDGGVARPVPSQTSGGTPVPDASDPAATADRPPVPFGRPQSPPAW